MQWRRVLDVVRDMRTIPDAVVRMSGGEESKRMFRHFTRPHSTYKIIPNKRYGVAMIELPTTFEEYLSGGHKKTLRIKRNKALAKGYTANMFNPLDRLEEILEINRSAENRQGRSMDGEYLELELLRAFFEQTGDIFGVCDKDGTLRAYAHIPVCGDVFVFNRLLGHAEDQQKGVMYLLISEAIRMMIERREREGAPLWAMYDTFFGASEGLRFFKERLGFAPYKVKWVWMPQ